MNKKVKIILAVVLSLICIAGVVLGIFFGIKEKNKVDSVFGDTANVNIISADKIEFYYSCPYMNKNTTFEIENEDGFYLTYVIDGEEKEIECEITNADYESVSTDTMKSGTLTLTVALDEKIKSGITYSACLEENAIELKKKDYKNPQIKADFSVNETDEGELEAIGEKYLNTKLSVPNDAEVGLVKKSDGKTYLLFTADISGVTAYDEIGMKNLSVIASLYCKTEDGGKLNMVNISENKNITVENGSVTVEFEIPKEDVHPGIDYKFLLTKGFFTNDDKSVVNDKFVLEFTYIEQ